MRMLMPMYPLYDSTKVFLVPPESVTNVEEKNMLAVKYMSNYVFINSSNKSYKVQCFKTNFDNPYIDYVIYYYDVVPVFDTHPLIMVANK